MDNKSARLRKFQGFNEDYFSSVGNHEQDLKTGQILAEHFYKILCTAEEETLTSTHMELKKLLIRMPKCAPYDGLLMGMFTQISIYIESLVKCDLGSDQDYFISLLSESWQYPEKLAFNIKFNTSQWLMNFYQTINKSSYKGLERNSLYNLVLNLEENSHQIKNFYGPFCYQLSLIINSLIKQNKLRK